MKKISKKHSLKLPVIISFLFGIATGVGYNEISTTASWHSFHNETDNLNVCFTPPSGCGSLIAQEISKAKDSIYIQAFGLTSQKIVDQLIKAKQNGVEIRVLLDRSNLHDRYSKMHELKRAGIDVSIDKVPGIAHNKIMIIDKSKVITGSFNFTNAADNRNAENVLLIENSDIAETYLQSWLSRKAKN
ncbi:MULTISPECIES: phospholipase D family protein [unclassified Candidatus Tisiphia]|uniref:phospholipase D family nuclease n=1 Tax=unclassified Candidatus Tisiphia TaxID=2996318 RepID=UPI00312C8796